MVSQVGVSGKELYMRRTIGYNAILESGVAITITQEDSQWT